MVVAWLFRINPIVELGSTRWVGSQKNNAKWLERVQETAGN